MQIGGYGSLQKFREPNLYLENSEGQKAKAATKLGPGQSPGAEHDLSVYGKVRTQVNQYMLQLKSTQHELSKLQNEELGWTKAKSDLEHLQSFAAAEKGKKDGEDQRIHFQAQKTRDGLAEVGLKHELENNHLIRALQPLNKVITETVSGASEDWDEAVEQGLKEASSRLEIISTEKEQISTKIAGMLVALENIAASQSAIRDPAYADKVMEKVRHSISENVLQTMESQASLKKESVLALLGI